MSPTIMLICFGILITLGLEIIIEKLRGQRCTHEFEEIKSIAKPCKTAFFCKKCGKLKKVKLKPHCNCNCKSR